MHNILLGIILSIQIATAFWSGALLGDSHGLVIVVAIGLILHVFKIIWDSYDGRID